MSGNYPVSSMREAIQTLVDSKDGYEAEDIIGLVFKETFTELSFTSGRFGGDGGKDCYDKENKNVYHIYSPIITHKGEALHANLHKKYKSDLKKVFENLNDENGKASYTECNESIHIMSIKERHLPKGLDEKVSETYDDFVKEYRGEINFKVKVKTFRNYFYEISHLITRENYEKIIRECSLEIMAEIHTNSLESEKIYDFIRKFYDIEVIKEININDVDDWGKGIAIDEKIELNGMMEFKRIIMRFVRDELGNFDKVYELMLKNPKEMLLFQQIRIYMKKLYEGLSIIENSVEIYDLMVENLKSLNKDFRDKDKEIENFLYYFFVYCDIFKK